jgi:cbb3-type cytochrome oxidase subunit 3
MTFLISILLIGLIYGVITFMLMMWNKEETNNEK